MSCEQENLLLDYVYRELGALDKEVVEIHLAACGACRASLAEIEGTLAHVRWLPQEQPSLSGLDALFMEAGAAAERYAGVKKSERRGFLPEWLSHLVFRPAFALSAMAALVLVTTVSLIWTEGGSLLGGSTEALSGTRTGNRVEAVNATNPEQVRKDSQVLRAERAAAPAPAPETVLLQKAPAKQKVSAKQEEKKTLKNFDSPRAAVAAVAAPPPAAQPMPASAPASSPAQVPAPAAGKPRARYSPPPAAAEEEADLGQASPATIGKTEALQDSQVRSDSDEQEIEPLFRRAEKAVQENRLDEAVRLFLSVADAYPQHHRAAEAIHAALKVELSRGNRLTAVQLYGRLRSSYAGSLAEVRSRELLRANTVAPASAPH